jgi:hypothetical protein
MTPNRTSSAAVNANTPFQQQQINQFSYRGDTIFLLSQTHSPTYDDFVSIGNHLGGLTYLFFWQS